jgi:ketosteroid isomerase-like protein
MPGGLRSVSANLYRFIRVFRGGIPSLDYGQRPQPNGPITLLMEEAMTEAEKQSIAQTFIASLRAQDADLLKSITTEDVSWTLPGASAVSGRAVGVAGIMKRAHGLAMNDVNLEILHVLYGLDDVAITLHNTSQHGGRVLDEYLTTVCLLRDNRIRQLNTYISDVPMLNTFFA